MITAHGLAHALGKAKKVGGGWQCLCPAHDDHDPSLSITEKNGKLLFTCRAGCDQGAVLDALKAHGLWTNGADQSRAGARPYVGATYDYVDEKGAKLFQVLRWGPEKKFSQQQPGTGKGGIKRGPDGKPTMQGARYVPYHLDELTAAKATGNGHPWRVFLCEGEKDADRLRQWGLVATTNAGGAKYWRPEYEACFAGSETILLEDNDPAGRERTAKLVPGLLRAGAVVRVIRFPHQRAGYDVSNWIEDGGTQGDLDDLVDGTEAEKASGSTPNSNDEDDHWPEPARLVGDDWETPVFPAGFLPGPLGQHVEHEAFDLQVPLDFIGIPTLIAIATAIGKEFRMAPKARATWTERCCLWGGITGYVGDGKSPAFNAALVPVWALQDKLRENFAEEFETYKRKAKLAKAIDKQWKKAVDAALARGLAPPPEPDGAEPPIKPVQQQLVAIDTTQERVADVMQHNPRGLMLFRDELSGWFRSFNQYRPGPDEQFYLQCHAGGPWFQQRKLGDIAIPDVYLNILGGFQPEVVAEALAHRPGKPNNGMAARFSLLVWPDQMARQWVDNPPDRETRARVNRLFSDLWSKTPEGFVGPRMEGGHFPPFRFTPEGQEVFRKWYDQHHEGQQLLEPDAPIKGHFAKYDGLFASLALVHHLIRHALGEPVELARVDEHTAIAVLDFIEGYLRPHARKIYRHLGREPGYDGAVRIARWIVANPPRGGFTAREISRKGWTGLTGKDENTGKNYLDAALRYLEDVAGWISEEAVPTSPRGGRPTIFYRINPEVYRLGGK